MAKGEFGNYLHDLGKILYFQDDYVLSNLVVLKPNWITKAISRVLTDNAVRQAKGILSHADLPRIWAADDHGQHYDPRLYPIFLRLMERFDLSYQITPDSPTLYPTHSLVPQLLPHQPPADMPNVPAWNASSRKVEMVYHLNFVPAGTLSWFIVRTHRYTADLHWREGVILQYGAQQAKVEFNPILHEIHLTVWGPQPHNLFTILMETLDVILQRFEGLRIDRRVPCNCHIARHSPQPCPRFHLYEDLARRMEVGRHTVECPEFLCGGLRAGTPVWHPHQHQRAGHAYHPGRDAADREQGGDGTGRDT